MASKNKTKQKTQKVFQIILFIWCLMENIHQSGGKKYIYIQTFIFLSWWSSFCHSLPFPWQSSFIISLFFICFPSLPISFSWWNTTQQLVVVCSRGSVVFYKSWQHHVNGNKTGTVPIWGVLSTGGSLRWPCFHLNCFLNF